MVTLTKKFWITAATLGAGSMFAQLISFATLPILTRIYLPSEFGKLSVLVAISAILAPLITMRIETIVLVTKSIEQTQFLLYVALVIISSWTAILLLILTSVAVLLLNLNIWDSMHLGLMVSLYIFAQAMNLILTQFSLRHRKIISINQSSITQNLSTSLIQISMGLINQTFLSLLTGLTLGRFVGLFPLLKNSGLRSLVIRKKGSFRELELRKKLLASNYLVPISVIEAAILNLPLIFLSYYFGAALVGNISVAQGIVLAPAILIGGSVASTIISNTHSDTVTPSKIRINLQMGGVFRRVFFLTSLYIFVLMLFASIIVEKYLGLEWQSVKTFIYIITLPYAVMIMWLPFVSLLYQEEKWRLLLHTAILRLSVSLVFSAICYSLYKDGRFVIGSFLIGNSLIQCITIYRHRGLLK